MIADLDLAEGNRYVSLIYPRVEHELSRSANLARTVVGVVDLFHTLRGLPIAWRLNHPLSEAQILPFSLDFVVGDSVDGTLPLSSCDSTYKI